MFSLIWYDKNKTIVVRERGYSLLEEDIELEDKNLNGAKPPKWDREEVVLLVVEYFRSRDLPRTERVKSISFLSKFLRRRAVILGWVVEEKFRNETGIEMKFGNLMSLDKQYTQSGCVGLRAASKLDKQVVEEYFLCPEKVKAEAYEVLVRYWE